MTSRTCVAVTVVSSSSGVRRTASSTAVHDVRPGSNAAMITRWPYQVPEHPEQISNAVRERAPGQTPRLSPTKRPTTSEDDGS